jgi:hypothetical protein
VCAKSYEDFFEIGPTNQIKGTKHLTQRHKGLEKERKEKKCLLHQIYPLRLFWVFLASLRSLFYLRSGSIAKT